MRWGSAYGPRYVVVFRTLLLKQQVSQEYQSVIIKANQMEKSLKILLLKVRVWKQKQTKYNNDTLG